VSDTASARRKVYVTTQALATALGYSRETISRWVAEGKYGLEGVQLQRAHYTDTKPRKTQRSPWRITLDSVEAMIERAYLGGKVPPGVRKWLSLLRRR